MKITKCSDYFLSINQAHLQTHGHAPTHMDPHTWTHTHGPTHMQPHTCTHAHAPTHMLGYLLHKNTLSHT